MGTVSGVKVNVIEDQRQIHASCCNRSGKAILTEADPIFGFRGSKLCSNVPQTLATFSVATLSHNVPKCFHSANNTIYSSA